MSVAGLVVAGILALAATIAEVRRDRTLAERVAALEVEVRTMREALPRLRRRRD